MKTKNTLKQILISGIATIAMLLMGTVTSNAALQITPSGHYRLTNTLNTWLSQMREMESVMGLSEELNSDLTPKTSNNIDVHMMKNTEFGTILILSASGYGNPSNETAQTSTTGNNTGVMIKSSGYSDTSHYEMTSAGLENSFSTIANRYYNNYTTTKASISGDAVENFENWHNSYYAQWISTTYPLFLRNCRGNFGVGNYDANYYGFARSAIVCADGI